MKYIFLFMLLIGAQFLPAQKFELPNTTNGGLINADVINATHADLINTIHFNQEVYVVDTTPPSIQFVNYATPFPFTVEGGSFADYDCIPWSNFTEWVADEESAMSCEHEWVYADYKDVNAASNTTTLQYCPCGCGGSSNEARICRKCQRNERRVKSWGYSQEKRESEYKKLLEQKKGNKK